MTDPRNRILDYALGRLLGAKDDVDQAAEIASAFERGQRGSVKLKPGAAREPAAAARRNGHAPGAGSPRTGRRPAGARRRAVPEEPRKVPRPFPVKALAAAATVLLVGGAAWMLRGSDERGSNEPGPSRSASLAVATGRLALLEGDRFALASAPEAGRELESGATVWVPAGAPADVRLASGADLALEGGSLARLVAFEPGPQLEEGVEVELEYGALRATSTPSSGLTLRAPGVEIALEPATELELHSEYDRRRPAPTGAASFAALEAEFETETLGWLSVRVLAGGARLSAGGTSRALAVDGEAFVALGAAPELVPAEEVDALVELIAELSGAIPYPEQALAACREAFETRPALLLPLAAPLAESLRAKSSSWRWRRDLIELLALDSTATSLRIARDVWLEHADAYSDGAKIALAERGAREFQAEAVATLTWYDEQDPDTDPFPAALYLALRDPEHRDLGVQYLQEAVQFFDAAPPKGLEQAPRALAAAVALKAVGASEPWERARDWVAASVDDMLAQGQFQQAASLVITFELMRELERPEPDGKPEEGALMSLSEQRLQERLADRVGELATDEDVRERLVRLLAE